MITHKIHFDIWNIVAVLRKMLYLQHFFIPFFILTQWNRCGWKRSGRKRPPPRRWRPPAPTYRCTWPRNCCRRSASATSPSRRAAKICMCYKDIPQANPITCAEPTSMSSFYRPAFLGQNYATKLYTKANFYQKRLRGEIFQMPFRWDRRKRAEGCVHLLCWAPYIKSLVPGLAFQQVIGCGQASRFGDSRLVYGGCFGLAYRSQTLLQLGCRRSRLISPDPMIHWSNEACVASKWARP